MKALIEKFYTAFYELDANKMVECYHPNITFTDPAFGKLEGERARGMWKMLCESQRSKDFTVEFSDIDYTDGEGSAKWEALYTFSPTGRKVHNKISASFKFKEGLIVKHTDDFNLYKWAKQAMGLKGLLLGNTSFFKRKLQQTTNKMLDKYLLKQTS